MRTVWSQTPCSAPPNCELIGHNLTKSFSQLSFTAGSDVSFTVNIKSDFVPSSTSASYLKKNNGGCIGGTTGTTPTFRLQVDNATNSIHNWWGFFNTSTACNGSMTTDGLTGTMLYNRDFPRTNATTTYTVNLGSSVPVGAYRVIARIGSTTAHSQFVEIGTFIVTAPVAVCQKPIISSFSVVNSATGQSVQNTTLEDGAQVSISAQATAQNCNITKSELWKLDNGSWSKLRDIDLATETSEQVGNENTTTVSSGLKLIVGTSAGDVEKIIYFQVAPSTPATPVCATPTLILIQNPVSIDLGNSSAVEWQVDNASADCPVLEYKYEEDFNGNGYAMQALSSLTATNIIRNPTEAGTYNFKITARNSQGWGTALTGSYVVKAPAVVCEKPVITLTSPADAQKIYLGTMANLKASISPMDGDCKTGWAKMQLSDDGQTWADYNLPLSSSGAVSFDYAAGQTPKTVYWRVVANNVAGETISDTRTFVVSLPEPLTVPTGLNFTAITQTQAQANWGAVSGAVRFSLQISKDATFADPNAITTYASTGTSYVLSNLTENTTYYVRVKAIDAQDQTSDWSVVGTFSTLPTPVVIPTPTPTPVPTPTPTPSVNTAQVLYSTTDPLGFSGISNVVLHNNKFMYMLGTDFYDEPSYPDPGVKYGKFRLIADNAEVVGLLESTRASIGEMHGTDLKLTPDGKLGITYRNWAGFSYAFNGLYKIWDGTAISTTENHFTNSNFGIYNRLHYGTNQQPQIASFSAAGYYFTHSDKSSGTWNTGTSSYLGGWIANYASLTIGDNWYISAHIDAQQKLFKKLGSAAWVVENLATGLTSNCDLKANSANEIHSLYVEGNNLKLQKIGGTAETVVTSDSLDHRATLYFDNAGVPYIAYMKGKTGIKVLKKVSGTWTEVYAHTSGLKYTNYYASSRQPSLLMKGADLYVVYNDNFKVYAYNLTGTPVVVTPPSGSTAFTSVTFPSTDPKEGYATDILKTSDGNVLLSGYQNFDNATGVAFLRKLNPNGTVIWEKTYPTTDRNAFWAVIELSDGGFLASGSCFGCGAGREKGLLVRTDAQGNVLWQKLNGGPDVTGFRDIKAVADGFIIAGYTTDTDPWLDYVLVKTDLNGNEVWKKYFARNSDDSGFGITLTSDGGFIISGHSGVWSSQNFMWLIKTDAAGNKIWDKTIGGLGCGNSCGVDHTEAIIELADGTLVVAGNRYIDAIQKQDLVLIKLDANGNQIWEKTWGGTSNERMYNALQKLSNGGFLLAGNVEVSANNYKTWVITTDANGNQISKDEITTGNSLAYSIADLGNGKWGLAGGIKPSGSTYNDVWYVTNSGATPTATPDLTTGLVLDMPMNGNAQDKTVNGNDGTVNGATLTTDRFGNANGAYALNGTSDFIEVQDHATLRPNLMSIAVWAKTSQLGGVILGKSNDDGSNEQYDISMSGYNGIHFAIKQNSSCIAGNGWQVNSANTPIEDNQWHFVVGSFDGSSMKIYVDGVLKNTKTNLSQNSIDNCVGGKLTIGKLANSYFFKGSIDDLKIYNRALNAAEVLALYNAPAPTPPIATTDPFGDPIVTPSTHTVFAPANLAVQGLTLANGDVLAAGYDLNGQWKVGLKGTFNGVNDAFTAYGDDLSTPAKDGFATSELLVWKLWKKSDGKVYDITATYSPTDATFTHQGAFAENGVSALLSLAVVPTEVTQTIQVKTGNNYVGLFVIPTETSLAKILEAYADKIRIVKYENTVWLPSKSLDQIGNWVTGRGYQILALQDFTITVKGKRIDPSTSPISLKTGWNLIAYTQENPKDAVAAFAGIETNLILAKDETGSKVYSVKPIAVNKIGSLTAGEGYLVKVLADCSLTYPLATSASGGRFEEVETFANATDNNATVLISSQILKNEGIANGARIQAISSEGKLVGESIFTGENVGLSIYGQDEQNFGLKENETFHLQIADNQGKIRSTEITFDQANVYQANGIFIATKMAVASFAYSFGLSVYPNPTSERANFDISLSKDVEINLEIFNAIGQKVHSINQYFTKGEHRLEFNAEGLANGLLMYRLRANDEVRSGSLLLQK